MQEPNWTDAPPTETTRPTLQLRRTGRDKTTGISLADKPIGTLVHFWRGRTRPCLGPNHCEACRDGQTRRWKGYLPMYDPATRCSWIHEFTPNAYEGLADAITAYAGLRGHWIKFQRTRDAANAPVRATVHATKEASDKLPPEPDVKATLNRIWDLEELMQEAQEQPDPVQTRISPSTTHRRNGQPSTT